MKLRFLILPMAAVSLSFSDPCANRNEMPAPGVTDKVIPVSVVYPRFEDIPRHVTATGKFLASDRLTVKAEFDGVMEKVQLGEGDRVSVGDPLCLFRTESIKGEIDKKQAELREAEAAVENDQRTYQLLGGVLPQPLREPEERSGGEAQFLDEEKNEPEPVPPKVNEPLNPPTEPQNVVENPDKVDWPSRIRLDEAKVERLTKELDQLEKDLTRYAVTAPIAGVIEKRHVTDGSAVRKDEPLYDIVSLHPITLSVQLPQEVSAYVDKMVKVKASPVHAPELALEGSVFYISPSIDPVKRTLEIRLHIPNEEGMIKEGQDGQAVVVTRKVDKLMVVPSKSIVQQEGKSYVFVATGNRVEKTEVTVGDPLGRDEVGIDANLRVDDAIVTSGQSSLENGTFIKILEEPSSSAPTLRVPFWAAFTTDS